MSDNPLLGELNDPSRRGGIANFTALYKFLSFNISGSSGFVVHKINYISVL